MAKWLNPNDTVDTPMGVVSKYVPKDAGKKVVIKPTQPNLPDDRESPSFVKQTTSDIPTVPVITRLESDHSMLESVDPISFPTMVVVPVQSYLNNFASVANVSNMSLTTEVTPVVDVSTPVLDHVVNNATLVTNVNFFTSGANNMTLVANPLANEVDVMVAHIRSNDDDGFTPVLLYWNACGVANASTRRVITRMVHSHHPFMLCLLEPFVSLSSIKPSMWRALRLFPVPTNDFGSQEPNLWLLCHVDVTPTVLSVTTQQLTVSCILDSVSCTIAYVYAKTTVVARHQLWYDLAYVKSFFVNGPWAIIGDFNCVLGAYEKRGSAEVVARSPFRFQRAWFEHPDFMAFVSTIWHDSNFLGCPIFVLSAKLRKLKQNLKTWNRSCFGNIHVNVDSAMSDLDLIQNEIDTLGPTDDRLSKEEELCLKAHDAFGFKHGLVLPHFNSNMIVLIPKVPNADSVSQMRPIALANFSFKIITKIIADRLGPITSRIISPQQSAFTKGLSISDSIILTSECMNLLDAKCFGGNVAVKFDIKKAFDTIDWKFLLRVLRSFGFSNIFVDWVQAGLAIPDTTR
ncbi:hypothetical protein ACFX15_012919 [Malus domestica]